MSCWQCRAEVARALRCPACDAVQPPAPGLDHFTRLGLPVRFGLDAEEVARRHRALMREVHPDRHAHRPPVERRFAVEQAAALNDALRAVRDPLCRAEYLLALRGARFAAIGEGPGLLEPARRVEIIELREAVAELDGRDAHEERGRLARAVASRYEAGLAALGDALDAGPEPAELPSLAREAARLRSLLGILEAIEDGE